MTQGQVCGWFRLPNRLTLDKKSVRETALTISHWGESKGENHGKGWEGSKRNNNDAGEHHLLEQSLNIRSKYGVAHWISVNTRDKLEGIWDIRKFQRRMKTGKLHLKDLETNKHLKIIYYRNQKKDWKLVGLRSNNAYRLTAWTLKLDHLVWNLVLLLTSCDSG